MSDKLWTTAELAQQIGMPQRYVRWQIDGGKLPAVKVGQSWAVRDQGTQQGSPPGSGRGSRKRRKQNSVVKGATWQNRKFYQAAESQADSAACNLQGIIPHTRLLTQAGYFIARQKGRGKMGRVWRTVRAWFCIDDQAIGRVLEFVRAMEVRR